MRPFRAGNFVLVHALIAGSISISIPSRGASAIPRAPTFAPPSDEYVPVQLSEVIVDPVVTDQSGAFVLAAFGAPHTESDVVGFAAEGDLAQGGTFDVFVNGVRTELQVLIEPHASADMTVLQEVAADEGGEVLATLKANMSLVSCTLTAGAVALPVLGILTTVETLPASEQAEATETSGFTVIGEAIDLLAATSFVQQVESWLVAQTHDQVEAPHPPGPPTPIPCCHCACQASAMHAATKCAVGFTLCLMAVAGAWLLGLALCALTCIGTAALFPVCFSLCMGGGTPYLATAAAGCLALFAECEAGVAIMLGTCTIACGVMNAFQ